MKRSLRLSTIILILWSSSAYSQRSNILGIYKSYFEEFDYNNAYQSSVGPGFAGVIKYSNRPITGKVKYVFPQSIGIFYIRQINSTVALRTRVLLNYKYSANSNYIDVHSGQSYRTQYSRIGLDYIRLMKQSANKKLNLCAFIGGQYRGGNDTYYLENLPPLTQLPSRKLRDLSLCIGTQERYYLPYNFVVLVEVAYSRWLYLRSNSEDGHLAQYGHYPFKPRNSVDFSFSLGYTFGKRLYEQKSPNSDSD